MANHTLAYDKPINDTELKKIMRNACQKIAPLWSLENFVAVNPYLGFSGMRFDDTAHYLARVGSIQMTLPKSFYLSKIESGEIKRTDLQAALEKTSGYEIDVDSFLHEIKNSKSTDQPFTPTLTDIAIQVTQKDWNRFVTSRISTWAASYFDKGQAIWNSSNFNAALFEAWKTEASIDLSPEISGLKGFRKSVKAFPNDPLEAIQKALRILDVQKSILPIYLHRLLLRLGGWSSHVARIDWDNGVKGKSSEILMEFLAVLVCWEACLLKCLNDHKLNGAWYIARKNLEKNTAHGKPRQEITHKLILQEAFDLATQHDIIAKFQHANTLKKQERKRPTAQAVFCIDVRSEVFRRNLEHIDPKMETLGFAGFFAFPINFIPLAHKEAEAQCPVLIPPGPTIKEELSDLSSNQSAYKNRIFRNQLNQVWKSFRSGAVTCYSFVSPLGISYLPKLFTDSFGLTRPVPNPNQSGLKNKELDQRGISLKTSEHNHHRVGIRLEDRIQMAKNALTAMSLTEDFAPFVLIVGHGATTVNNPYASGLDCGACGGRSGEPNAKVAAAILNDKEVRIGLIQEKINIPKDTIFLACLHDTTTDEITIYNEGDVPPDQLPELKIIKTNLAQAGKSTRAERALRMNIGRNIDREVINRSKDWSQVRPEWGLAGCTTFVIASRDRTANIDFGGQSFLHSYEWKKDEDFKVLELIMTAPMVVASWINLQYYASTVDNKKLGSGNKTLHNITAGLGVLEGYSGDLRVGLPIQSVHDGEKYQHEPVRLNVIIEAPIEAKNSILEKHPSVKDLCDNGWIHLLNLNGHGKVSHRYVGNLEWESI